MEIQGKWAKDSEGYMEFENSRLQRYYELVTNDYYEVYNRTLDELDDEEAATAKARQQGYQMITDYKTINGTKEFATTFVTPDYVLDVWYDFDPVRNKRDYERGSMSVRTKEEE